MAELILTVIESALGLVNKVVPDQATKIKNQIMDYRSKWDAELAKGPLRDDALLDEYDRELRDITDLFLAAVKSATSPS
jgi:hypothetical protein